MRSVHRLLSWLFVPLLLNALTGIAYDVGVHWIGFEKKSLKWLMKLHTGSIIAKWVGVWWPVVLTVSSVVFFITGALMGDGFQKWCARHPTPKTNRQWHRRMAVVALGPLLLVVISGGLFRSMRHILMQSKAEAAWMLAVHSGTYFGLPTTVFPLLTTAALLAMMCTGVPMMHWFAKCAAPGHRHSQLPPSHSAASGCGLQTSRSGEMPCTTQ